MPQSNITYDACEWLAGNYKKLLDEKLYKLLHGIVHEPIGEEPERFSELTFSGRMYIYHETKMLKTKIEKLRNLYQEAGLSPQFRGREYEVLKNSPLYSE